MSEGRRDRRRPAAASWRRRRRLHAEESDREINAGVAANYIYGLFKIIRPDNNNNHGQIMN